MNKNKIKKLSILFVSYSLIFLIIPILQLVKRISKDYLWISFIVSNKRNFDVLEQALAEGMLKAELALSKKEEIAKA